MEINVSYNHIINDALKKLGTMNKNKIIIHPECEEQAQKLLNALRDTILIEICAKNEIREKKQSVTFCGEVIAQARGRDSGAWIPPTVTCISGQATSGGSVANWSTVVSQGAVFRLRLPKIIYEKYASKETDWQSKIIDSIEKIEKIEDLI